MIPPNDSTDDLQRTHEETWNRIPWFLNGTLDEDESQAVREHLTVCEACRLEAREQETIREVVADADSRPERAPVAFAELAARIDRAPSSKRSTPYWTAALRMAAVLLLAIGAWATLGLVAPSEESAPVVAADPGVEQNDANGYGVNDDANDDDANYEVLGSGPCQGDVSVRFRPGTTQEEIDALLRAESLELACDGSGEGPTYKLRSTSGMPIAETVQRLKQQENVALALPQSP